MTFAPAACLFLSVVLLLLPGCAQRQIEFAYTHDAVGEAIGGMENRLGWSVQPLPESYRSRELEWRAVIDRELALYPSVPLERLVFAGRIEDATVGGMLGLTVGGSIVIAVEGRSELVVLEALHHELSSLMLRRYRDRVDWSEWDAALPDGFAYTYTWPAEEEWARKACYEGGFLSDYGRTSLENDFNLYAADLMSGRARAARFLGGYERVQRKREFVMALYAAADPDLTPAFFAERSVAYRAAGRTPPQYRPQGRREGSIPPRPPAPAATGP